MVATLAELYREYGGSRSQEKGRQRAFGDVGGPSGGPNGGVVFCGQPLGFALKARDGSRGRSFPSPGW